MAYPQKFKSLYGELRARSVAQKEVINHEFGKKGKSQSETNRKRGVETTKKFIVSRAATREH